MGLFLIICEVNFATLWHRYCQVTVEQTLYVLYSALNDIINEIQNRPVISSPRQLEQLIFRPLGSSSSTLLLFQYSCQIAFCLSGTHFMISKSGRDNFYLNCTFSFLYSLHSNSMLLTGQIKWATIRLVECQDLMTLKPNFRAIGLLHLEKYVLAWKSVMISDSWQYHMLVNPCTVCWRKESLLPPMWAEKTGNHWSPIHRYNQDATMRDLIYMTLIMIIWLLALVLSATNWSVMRQLLWLMTCLDW